jgi:PHD/YefM family antitoxin component YafN of YafNO toxin-antitoxin module
MKTIRAEEIPDDLSAIDFLQSLDLSEEVVVEKNGEPRCVLMSADTLQQQREARKRLFALIGRIRQQHAGADSDEILAELEEQDRLDQLRP